MIEPVLDGPEGSDDQVDMIVGVLLESVHQPDLDIQTQTQVPGHVCDLPMEAKKNQAKSFKTLGTCDTPTYHSLIEDRGFYSLCRFNCFFSLASFN